ncbi:MAG: hypothetical protein LBG19_09690 [Prevotellaceae bacterium]|jgi:hypothetical protein|nr:hypothetical protein [Prevotellaceae bacterium]
MKKIVYSIAVLSIFSCSKELDVVLNDDVSANDGSLMRQMAGDGEYDVLGFGYDITDSYLSPLAVKDRVVDIVNLAAQNPSHVYYNASVTGNNSFSGCV